MRYGGDAICGTAGEAAGPDGPGLRCRECVTAFDRLLKPASAMPAGRGARCAGTMDGRRTRIQE